MLNWDMVSGVVRHLLTFGGGFLVTKGLVDEGTMLELVGAAVTLVGFIWSLVIKQKPA